MSIKTNTGNNIFLPIISLAMIGFVILDQAVKKIAISELSYSPSNFGGFFAFELYRNYGIAFGLPFKTEAFYAIFFLFFVWMASGKFLSFGEMKKKELLAVGLILSGALGNLIDRIRLGYIIDFINFRDLVIFNLADVFIAVGIIMLIERFFPDTGKGKFKKNAYISLFVIFGALISFLIHAGIEIWYINLLSIDFSMYGLGLSWSSWYLIHGIGTVILFMGGLLFGFLQGKYWWKVLYEGTRTITK